MENQRENILLRKLEDQFKGFNIESRNKKEGNFPRNSMRIIP